MNKELKNLISKYGIDICDTDAIVSFRSSKVNNVHIHTTLANTLRGIRIKEFRPDIVELVWVGKDFDFNNKHLEPILYSDIPNALAMSARSNITIDLMHRQKFIDDMRRNSESNTNSSK